MKQNHKKIIFKHTEVLREMRPKVAWLPNDEGLAATFLRCSRRAVMKSPVNEKSLKKTKGVSLR
jgi:hypothetical protein